MPYLFTNASFSRALLDSIMTNAARDDFSVLDLVILSNSKEMRLSGSIRCHESNWNSSLAAQVRFY